MSSRREITVSPKITVVIPLYDKRVEEEACLESWCNGQTLSRDQYEVVVTSNGIDREAENRVDRFLTEPDRRVFRDGENMAGLYHLGAEESLGEWVYFTELHCVAEPQCLEKLVEYLEEARQAGACSFSYGDDTNVFAKTEAMLFDAMFSDFVKAGAARKVLLRGVAIKREVYFECGGFVARYNRLCDGLLGARIEDAGYEIGYARESKLLHYYNTSYRQFFGPVAEKATDEFLFRYENSADFCDRAFGTPKIWSQRQDFVPAFASELWRHAFKGVRGEGSPLALKARWLLAVDGGKWLIRSVFGGKIQLAGSFFAMVAAGGNAVKNRNRLEAHIQSYAPAYETIERHFHLRFLQKHLSSPQRLGPGRIEMDAVPEENLVGFHLLESWEGHAFRWSGPAAMLALALAPGRYLVSISLLELRGDPAGWLAAIYFANDKLPLKSACATRLEVEVIVPPAESVGGEQFSWLKLVTYPEKELTGGSPRLLGMPVTSIIVDQILN